MRETHFPTEQFWDWARQFALDAADAYEPDCIILFGSVARQSHTQDSDIDVVVIGGDLPADHRTRFRLLMRLRPRFAPLQIQTYTRAEWERMLVHKHVTVLDALRDGVPLHGELLFKRWQQQFERWQALGLRRTDCSWIVPPVLRQEPTPAS